MAYITYQQYFDQYGDPGISAGDFQMYAGLASDQIDSITQYRIPQGGGISALPVFVQSLVQKATAAQILYYIQNGLETVLSGQIGQSFTVGKVSVSGGSIRAANATAGSLLVSPLAVSILEQTPLMERGISVRSDRYLNPFWGI